MIAMAFDALFITYVSWGFGVAVGASAVGVLLFSGFQYAFSDVSISLPSWKRCKLEDETREYIV